MYIENRVGAADQRDARTLLSQLLVTAALLAKTLGVEPGPTADRKADGMGKVAREGSAAGRMRLRSARVARAPRRAECRRGR
jgi:hypothetical protein